MYICSAFLLVFFLTVNFKAHKFDTQDPEDPGEKHPSPMDPMIPTFSAWRSSQALEAYISQRRPGGVDGIRMGGTAHLEGWRFPQITQGSATEEASTPGN